MTGRIETMGVSSPAFVTAALTFLGGGGFFAFVIALSKRPLERAKQRLDEQVQADKNRAEARQGVQADVRLLIEQMSARLTQTEGRADRQGVKIEELQTQIDELRSEKMELRRQLDVLEYAKARETLRADTAQEQRDAAQQEIASLNEQIVMVKEQLRIANEELAERKAARRFGHRAGE